MLKNGYAQLEHLTHSDRDACQSFDVLILYLNFTRSWFEDMSII